MLILVNAVYSAYAYVAQHHHADGADIHWWHDFCELSHRLDVCAGLELPLGLVDHASEEYYFGSKNAFDALKSLIARTIPKV